MGLRQRRKAIRIILKRGEDGGCISTGRGIAFPVGRQRCKQDMRRLVDIGRSEPCAVLLVIAAAGRVVCVSAVETELVFDPPWSPERMADEMKFALGFF